MNFNITTYPVQAQIGHLPLPEELLTLVKDFVFFNASDFYQHIREAVATKSVISYIIKQSHARRLDEPGKWIFANFVQTIHDPTIFYPYGATRRPFNYFSATNCSACGNYSASQCTALPFKLWCKCKDDSAGYGLDQLFLEDASA
jgi:hypothetical protein